MLCFYNNNTFCLLFVLLVVLIWGCIGSRDTKGDQTKRSASCPCQCILRSLIPSVFAIYNLTTPSSTTTTTAVVFSSSYFCPYSSSTVSSIPNRGNRCRFSANSQNSAGASIKAIPSWGMPKSVGYRRNFAR